MANYRVKNRVYCMGVQYAPGDLCNEDVAKALGSDCELVAEDAHDGEDAPQRKTKPVKKASIKSADENGEGASE